MHIFSMQEASLLAQIIKFIRGHLSVSSALALTLTLVSVSLASGVIGPDTATYHALGVISAALTTLGFKSYRLTLAPVVS